jgi:hypothetical protein
MEPPVGQWAAAVPLMVSESDSGVEGGLEVLGGQPCHRRPTASTFP